MPRDSNGNASTDPVYVATPGTTIRAVQHNTPIADIIQMLTGSLARNGTGGMLADLPMGGFKITGLADGVNPQDAATKAQLDATLDGLPQLGAWTNVASASTVDLGAQESRNLVITGTTTITSFGTAGAADNVPYLLRFSGALTLTNGANLILPGGANIVTAVGDIAIVIHDDADIWRIAFYSRAAMPPLVVGTSANNLVALDAAGKLPAVDGSQLIGLPSTLKRGVAVSFTGTAVDFTGLPPGIQLLKVAFSGVSSNGGSNGIVQLGTEAGFAVTGYVSGGGTAGGGNSTGGHSATNGLLMTAPASASGASSGILTIARISGNKWVSGLASGRDDVNYMFGAGGRKELAEELTRIRLTTVNGTDVFDAGEVNIFWE